MATRPFARITAGPRIGDLVPEDWAIANGVAYEAVSPSGFVVLERRYNTPPLAHQVIWEVDVNARGNVVISWVSEAWIGRGHEFAEEDKRLFPGNYRFAGMQTLSDNAVDLIVHRSNNVLVWRIREWESPVTETMGVPTTPSSTT